MQNFVIGNGGQCPMCSGALVQFDYVETEEGYVTLHECAECGYSEVEK